MKPVRLPNEGLILKKSKRVFDSLYEKYPREPNRMKSNNLVQAREQWGVETYGLSRRYLSSLASGINPYITARPLGNLGFEVWVKDIETGEMEKVDIGGPWEIDHGE